MRKDRSWACKSEKGFQSGSKMTTTDADVKFSPTPPARVEMRKMPRVAHVLNSSTKRWRWPGGVPPSKRRTCGEQPCCQSDASKMSSKRVLREKMRTFRDSFRQCRSNGSNTCIFPHASGEPSSIRFATCLAVHKLWSMPPNAISHISLMRSLCACSAKSFGGCASGFNNSIWFVRRCSRTMSDKPKHLGGQRPRQEQSSAAASSSSSPFCSACRA
mmetsp:Transcript_20535/g.59523  ORF Transcript_20535/g.59523 Transcript_20535/m.59523 type:complete len:216 (+) Transcript_20535:612-1259(+)